MEESRTVYTIRPFERQTYFGDSGQIDGRVGLGRIVWGMPVMEDGRILEFETIEAAEAEAIKRGFTAENVSHDCIHVIRPVSDLEGE